MLKQLNTYIGADTENQPLLDNNKEITCAKYKYLR